FSADPTAYCRTVLCMGTLRLQVHCLKNLMDGTEITLSPDLCWAKPDSDLFKAMVLLGVVQPSPSTPFCQYDLSNPDHVAQLLQPVPATYQYMTTQL
ncbi:hypothetical protein KIPB_015207, partial [Kipferlia bialata]